jgi:hypothetical protein
MNSFKVLDSHIRYVIGVAAVLCAVILLSVIPAIAGAAQLSQRSVALSSSSAGASNVSYKIDFTSVGAADAFVVNFCSNSPLIGSECDAPAGFSVAGATTSTPDYTVADGATATEVVVVSDVSAAEAVSVTLGGINNPTAAGPLYARIVTYDTEANATAYTAEDLGDGAIDEGGAAISIKNTIGVSAAVMETLTFCVSGADIAPNCSGANGALPVLKLGEDFGGVLALQPGVVSEGSIHTQISTNALNGAVISLKSNATDCGGMLRAGSPTSCDILPAQVAGISTTANEARFGVRLAAATDASGGSANANGVLQPASGSSYNTSNFFLNYISGNATGITSPFGDPFLDTDSAPVNNKNMELTFGATVANNTPAGTYSVDLGLIATGKF